MIIILLISFLGCLCPNRAELEVINTTVIPGSSQGCLRSGRILQGQLVITSNPNETISDVPPNGICPNGTILLGPSVSISFGGEIVEYGLKEKCAKNGLAVQALAQSAQPLLFGCTQFTGVYLQIFSILQTVVSDQVPFIPEPPVRFNRLLNNNICARSALVTEGYILNGINKTEAINESCSSGQFLVKRGVVVNLVLLNSSACITSGFLTKGRVYIQGETVIEGQLFPDNATCRTNVPSVLIVERGVAILLELPTIFTTSTVTTTLFSTPPAVSSTLYSTVTSTAFLTNTRAYPAYPQYGSKQKNNYGVPPSMSPSGYPPKRDKSFKFYSFGNKAKTNLDNVISVKIKNRLGHY